MIFSDIEDLFEQARKFRIQQKKGEFLALLSILNSKFSNKINILEIGSCYGGTTFAFSHLAKKLISIDVIDLQYDTVEINNNCEFLYLQKDSRSKETFDLLKDEKFDFLFIDGGHSYDAVKSDFIMYMPLLNPSSIVAFHDIVDSTNYRMSNIDINKYWEEVKRNYSSQELYTSCNCTEILPMKYAENSADCLDWGGIGILEL